MISISPENWLILSHTTRFGDTDGAGVMHFHQLLRWCHEAWEESLVSFGLPASDVFPNFTFQGSAPKVGLPIVHCQADYKLPIRVGEELHIELYPLKLDASSFEIKTIFFRDSQNVAIGLIKHVAINAQTRNRCDLPEDIERWLEASSSLMTSGSKKSV